MSAIQRRLVSYILREHFGETIEVVGLFLIRKGARPLRDVIQDTKLKTEQVQKALCSLIQHRLATFEQNKKNITLYKIVIENILIYTRIPRFVYCARTLFGEMAELIIEEIMKHGAVQMSKIVKTVTDRMVDSGQACTESDVRTAFADLVHGHYLRRLSSPNQACSEEDKITEEEMQYVLPPEGSGAISTKRKRSTSEDMDQPAKRRKTHTGMSAGTSEAVPDEGILWHVNFSRFHQQFLDEAIVLAIEKKFDSSAAEIVKTMLKMDQRSRDPLAPTSDSITLYEIVNTLPSTSELDNTRISQYLGLMVDDQDMLVRNQGESGGGTYIIDIKKCVDTLCQHTIQSIIQERFGSSALRVFRLLLQKKHLEQKQIGELAMIPSKDAKELLYKLFSERFLTLQEVPRATDYAPSRTFYLFSVNLKQLSRMLLERSYQTLGNLMSRRLSEVQDLKRLLEKQERLDATIAALKTEHGEEAAAEAISELEELITASDRELLKKLKAKQAKLEQSEIQVDETVFILTQYISNQ